MKLTRKCKKDFDKWFITYKPKNFMFFDKLPISMKFGVIQDFADTKGICIGFGRSSRVDYFSAEEVHLYHTIIEDETIDYETDSLDDIRKHTCIEFNKLYNSVMD
tara:strand:+ start:1033 stop:1347 length:315 start_codon:yes stop_codon:yes gene_type:complete